MQRKNERPIVQGTEGERLDRLLFMLCGISGEEAGSLGTHPYPGRLDGKYLLLVAAKGEWRMTADGHVFQFAQPTAFIGTPGQYIDLHKESADAKGSLFFFEPAEAGVAAAQELWHPPADGEIPLDSFDGNPAALCETINREWLSEDPLERLHSRIAFQELLYRIWREARLRLADGPEQSLARAKRYVDDHWAEQIPIGKLAELAGVGYRHFLRLFRKKYGTSVIDYMTGLRMGQAKLLLADEQLSVKEIARQTGFADELYFRRRFKQQVGMPPAAYLRNRELRVAAYSFYNLGHLLPLGIIPQAAPLDHWWTDHYRAKYEPDVTVRLMHDYQFNREMLGRAGIDRIVGLAEYVNDEERDRLSQIAPTLLLPWTNGDWREHLRETARFVDREAQAEQWLAEYERKVQLVRKLLEERFRTDTVMMLLITPEGLFAQGERNAGTVLYGDLRLACPERLAGIEWTASLTPEELAAIDADHLFLISGDQPLVRARREALVRSRLWRELKAVRSRRVYSVAYDPWIEYTAYNHMRILDELVRMFGRRSRSTGRNRP